MTEWEVIGVLITLVTFTVIVGSHIIKLNILITRLIDRLNNLDDGLDELTLKTASPMKDCGGMMKNKTRN